MLLSIYDLDDSSDRPLCSFGQGEHLLGRGSPLKCADKRVSRKHVQIEISESTATITAKHQINPCFYRAAEGNHISILKYNDPVELNNGDKFGFFPDKNWFRIKLTNDVENVNNNSIEQDVNDSTTSRSRLETEETLQNNSTINEALHNNSTINKNCGDSEVKNAESTNEANVSGSNHKSEEDNSTVNEASRNTNCDENSSLIKETSPSTNHDDSQLENEDEKSLELKVADITNEDIRIETREINKSTKETNELNNLTNDEDNPANESNSLKNQESNSLMNEEDNQTSEINNLTNEENNCTNEQHNEANTSTIDAMQENVNLNNPEENAASDVNNTEPDREIKKENVSYDEDGLEAPNIHSAETTRDENEILPELPVEIKQEVDEQGNVRVKDEPVDPDYDANSGCNKTPTPGGNTVGASSNSNTVGVNTQKVYRDRCWYGVNCYRKNDEHRLKFSHPNDNDYDTDPDDPRPSCSYGGSCYRRNKDHRRDFKHSRFFVSTTQQPPNAPPTQQSPKKNRKRKDKGQKQDKLGDDGDGLSQSNVVNTKRRRKDKNLAESPMDEDYDLNDPFIDDSEDEFQMDTDASESEDDSQSQTV